MLYSMIVDTATPIAFHLPNIQCPLGDVVKKTRAARPKSKYPSHSLLRKYMSIITKCRQIKAVFVVVIDGYIELERPTLVTFRQNQGRGRNSQIQSTLAIDEFGFTYSRVSGGATNSWRCSQKNKGCKARIKIFETLIVAKRHEHNHYPKEIK